MAEALQCGAAAAVAGKFIEVVAGADVALGGVASIPSAGALELGSATATRPAAIAVLHRLVARAVCSLGNALGATDAIAGGLVVTVGAFGGQGSVTASCVVAAAACHKLTRESQFLLYPFAMGAFTGAEAFEGGARAAGTFESLLVLSDALVATGLVRLGPAAVLLEQTLALVAAGGRRRRLRSTKTHSR